MVGPTTVLWYVAHTGRARLHFQHRESPALPTTRAMLQFTRQMLQSRRKFLALTSQRNSFADGLD